MGRQMGVISGPDILLQFWISNTMRLLKRNRKGIHLGGTKVLIASLVVTLLSERGSESLDILTGDDESLHHLRIHKVAVKLIQLL